MFYVYYILLILNIIQYKITALCLELQQPNKIRRICLKT